MPGKFIVKGEIIGAFVDGLSCLAEKTAEVRLESNGAILVGSFVNGAHVGLCDVTLNLDGIDKDFMDTLCCGIDLDKLMLIPKLVDKDEVVSIAISDSQCAVSAGPSKRKFPLLGQVPSPLTPNPGFTATWHVPKASLKQIVDSLYLEGEPTVTIEKTDGDGTIKFSTKDYMGTESAEYLLTGDIKFEGESFKSKYAYSMFSSIKDIPTDTEVVMRCKTNFPVEMTGTKGPVVTKVLIAPQVEEEK